MLIEVTQHKKLLNNLRARLQGMASYDDNWYKTLRILNFVELLHSGVRKDNKTPEFNHQVSIALLGVTMLPYCIYPHRTINAIILHDTPEDYGTSFEELETKFGADTSDDVRLLTKEYNGHRTMDDEYFAKLSMNPVTSLVKLLDRIHNLKTMSGVFSIEKQKDYVAETEKWFLPFAKEARRRFPEQELAYEQAKFIITTMLSLYNSAHDSDIAL